MATAPTVNYPAAHVPATAPQPQPIHDPQHVDLELPLVNGSAIDHDIENKRVTNVDDQPNSADVSVSGGSDNEASRADGSRQQDGDKGHARTGSTAKKPATFKSVSVNRTFLASKAAANTASSKPTDKQPLGSSTPPTGSATLSVSRPRLVAKTGSGARDSVPRLSSAINGGKTPAAPDPSVVWNKNKPIPVPDPKKFTDEELKKYGIHMASRLDEDDTQGQNKWADIDDDDEDWAPDAITWGDGTKTTLPHSDDILPPPPSDSGSVASRGMSLETSTSPAPPGPVSSPMPKSGGLASGKGLVLKSGAQERPSLVAKPPAPPTPAKSPWASLPAVERASPVTASESLYIPRGGLTRESPLPPKGMTPPPKEIAADDFSRASWRDGASHGNRELFNSQSGRYEPVPDRRGSIRADQARHPALLQRPTGGDQPAEPSNAFQTSRGTQDVPSVRRRGSSNVSGGSGSYMQRLGKGSEGGMPPADMHSARRTSIAGSIDSPVSPGHLATSAHGQPRHQPLPPGWMHRASPTANSAAPHPLPQATIQPPTVPAQPQEDDVEFQKKLMRERVELARKRRQDEEAKEEAAKKERIQKKLEALGPAPEKKSDKNDLKPVAKPTQIQQREQPAPDSQPKESVQKGQEEVVEASANKVQDSPLSNAKSVSPEHGNPPGPASRRLSQGQDGKKPDLWTGTGQRGGDRFATWASGPQPPRNVWGSPDNDRGLGNGTFNPDLGRPGSSAPPLPSSGKGPSPIAPPSTVRAPPQTRPEPPAPQAAGGSRASRYGAPGSDLASKWVSAVAENDKKMSAERAAERAQRERQLLERGVTLDDVQPTIKDTWRPVHVPGDGTRRNAPSPTDGRPPDQPGALKAMREDLPKGPQGPAHKDNAMPLAKSGVIGSASGSILPQQGQAGSTAQSRASRFFPARDAHVDSAQPARPNSPSPPPPTMEGHPVYEGDVTHPHVSLPRPQPVVKLPPALGGSQSPPQPYQGRASFGWANPVPFRDATRSASQSQPAAGRVGDTLHTDWQNRINTLLNGGKQSPPKAMGVNPASKNALDHAPDHDPATVSLPGVLPTVAPGFQRPPVTKPMAEECFEEQEMGSLPQIRLPHVAPEAAWQPASTTAKPLPKKFAVQASIMEPYYFSTEVTNGGNTLRIQFPGMNDAKLVTLPLAAARGARSGGPHGRSPRHRGSGQNSRGAKRDTSSTYESHGSATSGRSGRGTYRGRGSENWNRHPHAQPSLPA